MYSNRYSYTLHGDELSVYIAWLRAMHLPNVPIYAHDVSYGRRIQAVPEYRRTEVERAQYYLMMLAALGTSPDCGSVQTVALGCITVSILRMQVSRAQLFVSLLISSCLFVT